MCSKTAQIAFDLGADRNIQFLGEHNKLPAAPVVCRKKIAVRRVLDAEVKNGTLRLAVQTAGSGAPYSRLEICRERDRRSPSTSKANCARAAYQHKLRRMH